MARCSARARRASDMGVMVGRERGGGRRILAHPYPARQMSDFGFRQTLKVRTLGCARRLRLLLPVLQRSKLLKELHKGHKIYTGSGHRCGVIPYSSVWLVDCLLGLMMITIQGRTASRGSVLGWGDELLGGVQPPFSLSLTLSACEPNE